MHSVEHTVLEVASRLFYERGFHATGVDLIIHDSGCAKSTFYQKFKSKDELVCAVLRSRHFSWLQWIDQVGMTLTGTPEERTSGLFDLLGQWFRASSYRGSLFLNAAAEYPAASEAVRDILRAHVKETDEHLGRLIGISEASARQLGIILRGAMSTAEIDRSLTPSDSARRAAILIVQADAVAPTQALVEVPLDLSPIGY